MAKLKLAGKDPFPWARGWGKVAKVKQEKVARLTYEEQAEHLIETNGFCKLKIPCHKCVLTYMNSEEIPDCYAEIAFARAREFLNIDETELSGMCESLWGDI
jgi:hypothetical protein